MSLLLEAGLCFTVRKSDLGIKDHLGPPLLADCCLGYFGSSSLPRWWRVLLGKLSSSGGPGSATSDGSGGGGGGGGSTEGKRQMRNGRDSGGGRVERGIQGWKRDLRMSGWQWANRTLFFNDGWEIEGGATTELEQWGASWFISFRRVFSCTFLLPNCCRQIMTHFREIMHISFLVLFFPIF